MPSYGYFYRGWGNYEPGTHPSRLEGHRGKQRSGNNQIAARHSHPLKFIRIGCQLELVNVLQFYMKKEMNCW